MAWHFKDLGKYPQFSTGNIYIGDINGDRPIHTTKYCVLTVISLRKFQDLIFKMFLHLFHKKQLIVPTDIINSPLLLTEFHQKKRSFSRLPILKREEFGPDTPNPSKCGCASSLT